MKGKVQTVLGALDPDQLGVTLTHEHLLHDLRKTVFRKPFPPFLQATHDICLDNLGFIRQYPYCYDQNMEFGDEGARSAVLQEMEFFKGHGGGTVVDNCSVGLRAREQPLYLQRLSRDTGVHIVAGTGFYVGCSQSDELQLSVEAMCAQIRGDLLEGMEGTDIRCGVIGEVGCSHPLQDFERRSLVSSATVQQETGCPVIIHPGRSAHSPSDIFRVFQEAGGDVRNTVMSHLDRTFLSREDLLEFANRGSYCEYDLFGLEVSHYQQEETIAMPSDAQRIDFVRCLVEEGFGDRVLIAHDIHTKHRLMKYGGHGFSHILLNVVPQMRKRGISDHHIGAILRDNPKNWLTFK